MNEDKYQSLYNLIITERDRNDVLSFLTSLSDTLFKVDGAVNIVLENNQKYGKIISELLPEDWSKKDKNVASKIIADLKQQIGSIKSVEVDLAIEPTEKIIHSLAAWAKRAFTNYVILNITVKPEIMGGVIIVVDGVYKDISLSRKLNEAFTNKQADIAALVSLHPTQQ